MDISSLRVLPLPNSLCRVRSSLPSTVMPSVKTSAPTISNPASALSVLLEASSILNAQSQQSHSPLSYSYPSSAPATPFQGVHSFQPKSRVETPYSESATCHIAYKPPSISTSPHTSSIGSPNTGGDDKVFSQTCHICNEEFATLFKLRVHLKTVHQCARPYICNMCDKAFTQSSSLHRHMKVHTGNIDYACPHCDKHFSQQVNLEKHVLIHVGQRPFKCTFEGCHKMFSTVNVLRAHLRTHTGERPFQCTYPGCDKRFGQVGHLVRHKQTHENRPRLRRAAVKREESEATSPNQR